MGLSFIIVIIAMTKHLVYFYGSTKIVTGSNSLGDAAVRERNQIIGFEGIDVNPELMEFGESCLKAKNKKGGLGETGTLYPKENITIVPFRYLYREHLIISHLEDVIEANEKYIKADSIGLPLMNLKEATAEGYHHLENTSVLSRDEAATLKSKWCCYGHYYLNLLKRALHNKGYSATGVSPDDAAGNLINTEFYKADGTRLIVHADAGL